MAYTVADFSKLKEIYKDSVGRNPTIESGLDFLLENFVDDVCLGEEFLIYKTKLSSGEIKMEVDIWKDYLLGGKKDFKTQGLQDDEIKPD